MLARDMLTTFPNSGAFLSHTGTHTHTHQNTHEDRARAQQRPKKTKTKTLCCETSESWCALPSLVSTDTKVV